VGRSRGKVNQQRVNLDGFASRTPTLVLIAGQRKGRPSPGLVISPACPVGLSLRVSRSETEDERKKTSPRHGLDLAVAAEVDGGCPDQPELPAGRDRKDLQLAEISRLGAGATPANIWPWCWRFFFPPSS